MDNVISVIVVLVFVGIVFRKRLAPLIRGRKNPDKSENDIPAGDTNVTAGKDNVYFKVIGFDVGAYLDAKTLSEAIDAKLHKELDLIYRSYVGSFIGIDYIMEGDMLLFLIKWQT